MTNALALAAAIAADPPSDPSLRYQLRYLGDPILRERCPAFTAGTTGLGELPHVIAALKREMAAYRGLGLSANQVGSTLRVFVACLRKREVHVFVDPAYIGEKGPLVPHAGEGCLSIPGFRTSTKRHESVTIRWTDATLGPAQARTFSGLEAQIIQHAMDQLEGRMLVDLPGITRQQRREAERLAAKAIEKAARRA